MKSSALDGLDALLSTVQMPKGIPVATVAIDGADNAALLAVQILAVNDEELSSMLQDMRNRMTHEIIEKDKSCRRMIKTDSSVNTPSWR